MPPIGGNDEPGEEQYITPVQTSEPWGQAPGEPPEIQGSGDKSGGGTSVELALAPGYEQTAQVAHYATLMAQAEALQAGTLSVKNSQIHSKQLYGLCSSLGWFSERCFW